MEYQACNAATGEPLEPGYRDATVQEIGAAADAALAAWAELERTEPERRATLLERIAAELESRGAALTERAHLETGLPRPRLESERGRTVMQLGLFADLLRDGSWVDARVDPARPDRKPLPRPDVRRMLRPLGPVAVFGASNFPLAFSVAGGDTAAALAAGNPVVVKAHPAHPGTSDLAAEAVRTAVSTCGLPPGTFGMVHGVSPEVSLALVRHPAIQAVGFTGSYGAGRSLLEAAAGRPTPIPVFAEMSSTNPVFLLPQALRERGEAIAAGLTASFTLGVGQFCTKPGLVFGIESPEWSAFGDLLAARAGEVPVGVMLHAGIASAFARSLRAIEGVEWLARGAAHVARIRSQDYRGRPGLGREVFGPYILLVTARDGRDLVLLAKELEGQLTATVHGSPGDLAGHAELSVALARRAGRLVCNGYPTGVEVVPAMHHGGPYPATTDARFTSVGTASIFRFARPVCYQDFPDTLLPEELRDGNPRGILRLVDGRSTRDPVVRPA
jgi:NADP-dependent aldehyde dehydrogenase